MIREVQPRAALKYNKHYIGLEIDGAARNFVAFKPKKSHVIIEFKLPEQGEEVKTKLLDSGMRILAYDSQFGMFRVSIGPLDLTKQREALRDLTQRAWEEYGEP